MSLFQNTVVSKYLNTLDPELLSEKWEVFSSHFHDPVIQENIRNSKEEQYQEGFLRDLFVKVLGYTLNPHPGFNLTTEYKNVKDAKKADGAVIIGEDVPAVIELKGTDTTDLGTVEDQAFGYKNNQPTCKYVVISNFEKLRFYIDNAIEHIEFNLFKLTKEEFNLLYLCLARENIKNDTPSKIKNESLSKEDEITKQLYKDYSVFKRELFQNLIEQNPEYNQVELFKKSQKLLDRFLFLFFGEDRGLLPPNSVRMILDQWSKLKELDAYTPLYERFKKYFGYLNTGFEGKHYDVFAYNGGLFKPDEILDNTKIDDELLYTHTLKLSEYDFESEVDVNILGHIFEHSLNEIDEIKAQLAGEEIDKTQTKRKKDGVFYTPKYITKYIVENTVGKLCEEEKAKLGIKEEDYYTDKKRQLKTKQKLLKKLQDYRKWLHGITIIDPACGSGSFLIEALNFLIEEHSYIDEMEAKLTDSAIAFSYHPESILENNLYGVDINEESVEIAKLSLWLRTAEPNRKLSSLSHNLKCGNSLIDDPEVAGDLAFNWEKEFPKVFAKGGFDVVIGNPPYVKFETIRGDSERLEKAGYQTYDRRGDLYVLFVEKGFSILKEGGLISYIMPNKWMQAGYGEKLRSYFLEKRLIQLIDFGDIQIFDGATTYPIIFIAGKQEPDESFEAALLTRDKIYDFEYNIESNSNTFFTKDFSKKTWVISSLKDKELLEKLKKKFPTLKEFVNGEANYGIKPGLTKAFIIDKQVGEEIKSDNKTLQQGFLKTFVQGRDIKRYLAPDSVSQMIIIEKGFSTTKHGDLSEEEILEAMIVDYPKLFEWLIEFKDKAKKRTDQGDFWWELRACDYYSEFEKPKIMYQKFQVKPCFIFDETGLYCNDSMWIIPTDDKGLLAILNSKLGWWLVTKYCTQIQNGYQLIWKYFGEIPIAKPSIELSDKGDQMLSLNKDLQEVSDKFKRTLHRKFELEKLSRKLQDWYLLSFGDFIKELKKKKIKLSLSEEAEWEDYFLEEQAKALSIQSEIDATDKEIDQMVYQLYGLTEEEIEVVERG